MRRLKIALVSLVLLILATAGVLALTRRSYDIANDIWIARPPAEVWRVLTETAAFPSWNPAMQRLDGRLAVGQRITVDIGAPGDTTTFHPILLEVATGRALRWRGGFWPGGIFDGEHGFRLLPEQTGTRFIQSERFSGLLVGTLTRGMVDDTERSFRAMNTALKDRVEASTH